MITDTAPKVEARLDALMRSRSGSDRVIMASDMFDLAKELIMARLKAEAPDISETELRVRLFERLYGDDLDAETIARVTRRIRGKV